MAEKETPKSETETGSTKPVAEVKIIPPQSVSVKNSMPKDGIPPHITQIIKDVNKENGKEKE